MKRKLLIVYVFIAFVLVCTNVYAALTMDLSLVPESEKVKQGSDLVVAVKLNNVSGPVSSIEGYINVDENVLEPISESMIKGDKIEIKADGKKVSDLDYVFNPQNTDSDYDVVFNTKKENIENNDCFFIMDLRKDIKGNCDIMTLNFKVKDNATVAQATQAVKFIVASAVSASDLKDKVTDLSANLSFEVLDKNASTEEPPKPDENKTDENKTDDNNKPDDNKPEKKELKGEISYSTTSETTGPVTATLKVDDGVTVTNNSGKKTYTFSKNGYYIFEFADDDGNTGKARAEVSWIKSTAGNGNNNDDKKDDKKNENKNVNNTTNTNKNTNNTTNNTNKNVNSNKNVNDTTVSGNKIPKAGAGMLMLPVVVFAVLGYVSYIKYLKYKEF